MLVDSIHEAAVYHRQLNRKLETYLLGEMKKAGLEVDMNPDRAAIAEVVKQKTQEEYAQKFGGNSSEIQALGK